MKSRHADIGAALREAKRGDFASEKEVQATIAKYTKRKEPRVAQKGPRASRPAS